ncbi:MAG: PH domain-containing protein [Saprospiraceae bacterium]|nr:hypothetical protein [Saprospiraceae bacterium]
MKFDASLDIRAKLTSIGVVILFVLIMYFQIGWIDRDGAIVPYMTAGVFIIILSGTFIFRPLYYSLTNQDIIINRPVVNVVISREHINSIRMLEPGSLNWSLRTFGVGGLFGYFGKFYKSGLGNMTWYATRKYPAILLLTNDDKRIVITPDDPEKFIEYYQQRHQKTQID